MNLLKRSRNQNKKSAHPMKHNISNISTRIISGLSSKKDAEENNRAMEEEADIDFFLIELEVGEGPMRFAPKGERSLLEQISDLDEADQRCHRNLKRSWDEYDKKEFDMKDDMILRFARNTTKDNTFDEERAWKLMRKFKRRYAIASAHRLEKQLMTKTIFPVPGLKTKDGHEMFYMRPARYFPKQTSTRTIIDNLSYAMHTILEKERPCRDGIGFLACMDDWTMENFNVDYCFQFMMALQGYIVPVRVQLFLIVNPPSWFGAIWKIMKPMLIPSFRKKVKMIKEKQLYKYLQDGFEEFLPDEMELGNADTDTMVEDFVAYRKYLDELDPNFERAEESHGDTQSRTCSSDERSLPFSINSEDFDFDSDLDE